jgi:DNA-binding transcriptional MerR regulator
LDGRVESLSKHSDRLDGHMTSPSTQGYLRIGELARRVGLSPDVLRAWERRYQLLDPERTPGGFRLYSDADVARVVLMQQHLATGLAPAQAAARVRAEREVAGTGDFEGDPIAELRAALEGFDEGTAHRAIDHIMERFAIESVVTNVIFPYLRDVGDRWHAGEVTVAQEHFASAVLRSRLIGRGRGWDDGTGPRAVLACAPQELHDLPLVCLGLALREQGWRITLLGADTPIDTVMTTTGVLHQDLTVLSFMMGTAVDESREALAELARRTPLVLAGPGVSAEVAAAVGAVYVNGDPIAVARRLTLERPVVAPAPPPVAGAIDAAQRRVA